MPVDRAGLYVPGGRAPLSVDGADDGDPGPGRRRSPRSCCASPPESPTGNVRPTRSSPRPRSPASTRCTASAARRRSRRWPTAPSRSAPVDVIVGPGNALRRRGQARGRRAWSASTSLAGAVGARGRRRRHRRPRVGRGRPARAGRARSRRRGRRRSRGTRRSPTRVDAALDALLDAPTRRAEAEATLRVGRPARARRRRRRRRSTSPTRSRPSTSSSCAPTPTLLVPLVRNAGAVFVGPYAPAVIGDYVAGVEPRAAHRRHRAVRERAARRRLPEAHPRRRARRATRSARVGPVVTVARRGRRARRARRVGPHARGGRRR